MFYYLLKKTSLLNFSGIILLTALLLLHTNTFSAGFDINGNWNIRNQSVSFNCRDKDDKYFNIDYSSSSNSLGPDFLSDYSFIHKITQQGQSIHFSKTEAPSYSSDPSYPSSSSKASGLSYSDTETLNGNIISMSETTQRTISIEGKEGQEFPGTYTWNAVFTLYSPGEMVVHSSYDWQSDDKQYQCTSSEDIYSDKFNFIKVNDGQDSSFDIEPPLSVKDIQGNVIAVSPQTANLVSKVIPPAGVVIITAEDAQMTIVGKYRSLITIQPDTMIALSKVQEQTERMNKPVVLSKGSISFSNEQYYNYSEPDTDYRYEFRTPIGQVIASSQNQNTQFSLNYSPDKSSKKIQSQQIGEISISVISGTVDFYNARGEKTVLTSGREYQFDDLVTQSQILLPVDGGEFYGGETNYFIWTAYEEASQYLFEFNLLNPGFSQENAEGTEFPGQTLPIAIAPMDDLIIFPLPLPKIEGNNTLDLEFRVFPLDAAEAISPYAVSSDNTTITIK